MLERIKPLDALVVEILDQLPKEVWTSKTSTFLDPAMGGGQFVFAPSHCGCMVPEEGGLDKPKSGKVKWKSMVLLFYP